MIRFTRSAAATATATALAALLVAAPGARACPLCPIDDFESGGFDHLAINGFLQQTVPIPAYQSHSVAPQRLIEMQPAGGLVHARLTPTSSPNDYMAVTVDTGRCEMEWDWGFPVDITAGGTVDCVDLQIQGPAGAEVLLEIGDAGGSTSESRWLAGGGIEVISWYLPGYLQSALVDITQATRIRLHLTAPPSSGDYLVYDLRFGTGSGPVDLSGNFTATQFPPLPTPPLTFDLYDVFTASQIYQARVTVENALTDAQTVPPSDWTWSKTTIGGQDIAQMSLQWNDFNGVQETDFEIGVEAAPLSSPLIDLYPPDPVHGPESILLSFPVVARDATGAATGVSNTLLVLEFDAQQLGSLEFQQVSVTENPVARNWTDGFRLNFRMAFSGMNTPDYAFPLFHATWISDWSTQVPTGVVEGASETAGAGGTAGAARLAALPTVSSTLTRLRADRPFPRGGEVRILDAAGRVLRRLPAPAGGREVTWDGRTDAGEPVASGVYFAVPEGAPTAEAARIVRLR